MQQEQMTNREAVSRWAEYIIPAVFKAEDALKRTHPEWIDRLQNLTDENASQTAREYCEAIATIIVKGGTDYQPDGTLDE